MRPVTKNYLNAERGVIIVGGLALSALFFWLLVMILSAPMHEPPITRWSLRAFAALMFGSIGLASLSPLASFIRERRELRALERFEGRCLGCGLLREGSRACDRCGHPFEDPAPYWTVAPNERAALVIGTGFAGAILSLGVFMGTYAFSAGPLLGRLFIGLLALLIGGVGLIGTAGAIGSFFEPRPARAPSLTYARQWKHRDEARSASISLVHEDTGPVMRGAMWRVIGPDAPLDARDATAFERSLAWAIARCAEDARVALRHDRSVTWTAHASPVKTPERSDASRAYRTPAKSSDEAERVERDAWEIVSENDDPSAVLSELGLPTEGWRDVDIVEVSTLVRVASESPAADIESRDPGVEHFSELIAAMALRAVIDARRYSTAGSR